MINGYYTQQSFFNYRSFWEFAPVVADFDMSFSGFDTEIICITSVPAGEGEKWARDRGRVWAPVNTQYRGVRVNPTPLPWRWCLSVALNTGRGNLHHHRYHDALDHDDVRYNDEGDCVLKYAFNERDLQNGRYGRYGALWPDWLRVGKVAAAPGQALAHLPVKDIMLSGVSVMNKARRAQALRFNRAISFESKIAYLLKAGATAIYQLLTIHGQDTGGWITGDLSGVTTNVIGTVVALAQAHKDNNASNNGGKINGGEGWRVRYGPTGATLEDQLQMLQTKQQKDLEHLQKFPKKQDVQGEDYFENVDAQEWFTVADDWANYYGGFGYFDFHNLDQQGLDDVSRLDNYTPMYPDLPFKVDNLPQPQKNPERKIPLPGLFV